MLKIKHCDRCQEPNIILITKDGENLCGQCAKIHMRCTKASDNHFRNKIYPITEIDLDCHLDVIGAQLMAFYITNGMSVRQCACQLGINHATVYARLRKFGMLKPVTQTDAILNPHIGDFIQAGGLKKKFTLLTVTQQTPKPKKCVTRQSADPKRSPADQVLPGKPASNVERS